MPEFSDSRWADAGFAHEYLEDAEAYIPFRRVMLQTVASFCSEFLAPIDKPEILDLGCGDGILTSTVLSVCPGASSTLVDGSREMLDKAEQKFAGRTNFSFVQTSFQELIEKRLLEDTYDLVLSSFAIHHLSGSYKESLYWYLYAHIKPGGHFINLDVVLAPGDELEQWYMRLWWEWIDRQRKDGVTEKDLYDIPLRYKDNPDNLPDTIDLQLHALRTIGFKQVDCYFKYGVFAIFGGRKPK